MKCLLTYVTFIVAVSCDNPATERYKQGRARSYKPTQAPSSSQGSASNYKSAAPRSYKPIPVSPYTPAPSYERALSYKKQPYTPASYSFDWSVKDDYSGNNYGHSESRDGKNTVGSYYVGLPDGRLQKVSYTVDAYGGYNAEVTYEGDAKYPETPKYKSSSSYKASPSYTKISEPSYQPVQYRSYEPSTSPSYKTEPTTTYKPIVKPTNEQTSTPAPEPATTPSYQVEPRVYYKPYQPVESRSYRATPSPSYKPEQTSSSKPSKPERKVYGVKFL